jgi:hypothetical protein
LSLITLPFLCGYFLLRALVQHKFKFSFVDKYRMGNSLFWLQFLGLTTYAAFCVVCTLSVLLSRLYSGADSKFRSFQEFGKKHPFSAKTGITTALLFAWYGFYCLIFLLASLNIFGMTILIIAFFFLLAIHTAWLMEYFLSDWSFAQMAIALIVAAALFVLGYLLTSSIPIIS